MWTIFFNEIQFLHVVRVNHFARGPHGYIQASVHGSCVGTLKPFQRYIIICDIKSGCRTEFMSVALDHPVMFPIYHCGICLSHLSPGYVSDLSLCYLSVTPVSWLCVCSSRLYYDQYSFIYFLCCLISILVLWWLLESFIWFYIMYLKYRSQCEILWLSGCYV